MLNRVLEILQRRGGYKLVPEPLHIAEIEFKFPAVLQGPTNMPGLVVVIDGEDAPADAIVRRLRGFRTVLSRRGLRRPITAVLIHPVLPLDAMESLKGVCRIISLQDGEDPTLNLRPLLPLDLPEPIREIASAKEAFSSSIGDLKDFLLVENLLSAAEKGAEQVRNEVRNAVFVLARKALINTSPELK